MIKHLSFLTFAGWLFACAVCGAATADLAGSGPPAEPPGTRVGAGLELRGILVDQQGPNFALYDANSGSSRWFRLHQGCGGYTIAAFEAAHDSIILESPAGTLTLMLAAGKTGSPGAATAAAATPPSQPTFDSAVPAGDLPADELQRLNALAAEVRRIQAALSAAAPATPGS